MDRKNILKFATKVRYYKYHVIVSHKIYKKKLNLCLTTGWLNLFIFKSLPRFVSNNVVEKEYDIAVEPSFKNG